MNPSNIYNNNNLKEKASLQMYVTGKAWSYQKYLSVGLNKTSLIV